MPLRHLNAIPPIKTVMTPFPSSIEAEATIDEARRMMDEHRIHHLPVKRDGALVGVISDQDLERSPELAASRSGTVRVQDACRLEAYVVDLHAPLDGVLLHMAAERLDAALVVKEGRLAGIFTTSDACRTFGDYLRVLFPAGGDDAA